MPDPCLSVAIEMIDQVRSMPTDEAARYLLSRYNAASQDVREALVLALVAALQTTNQMLHVGPMLVASGAVRDGSLVHGDPS